MRPALDDLPVEIYLDIIAHIDPESFNQTLVSLSYAIPRSPVPTHFLYENIALKRREQVFLLYRHLRHAPLHAKLVRKFSLQSWTVDAEVFVNLVALLPSLVQLSIFIGPNFLPEHIEEVFEKPMPSLRHISLRFRPYVQRATYYHFLAGAYYDSTVHVLSRWPQQELPTLSMVQDPPDPLLVPKGFAQPLVFHSLIPLGDLAVSPLCYDLQHLRMRVPSRQICRPLYEKPTAFPSLKLLDMSTSNVSTHDLEWLLSRIPGIQTLILDGCPIVSQRTDVQADAGGEPFLQWMELGRALALAGVERAREREKQLKTWLEKYHADLDAAQGDDHGRGTGTPAKKKGGRGGRKGLATAAFSLRGPERNEDTEWEVTIPQSRIPAKGQRVRVLPSAPTLRALATSFPGGDLSSDTATAVHAEFERGWASGIVLLTTARARLRTSYLNGVARVVRFAKPGELEWEEEREHGLQGLAGLVDVVHDEDFSLKVVVDTEGAGNGDGESTVTVIDCPTLCLAGPARDVDHIENCGHRLGWDTFMDEI